MDRAWANPNEKEIAAGALTVAVLRHTLTSPENRPEADVRRVAVMVLNRNHVSEEEVATTRQWLSRFEGWLDQGVPWEEMLEIMNSKKPQSPIHKSIEGAGITLIERITNDFERLAANSAGVHTIDEGRLREERKIIALGR